MIRLDRSRVAIPEKLVRDALAETEALIEAFSRSEQPDPKSSVYGHESVKAALTEIQHNKCCFCEVDLTRQFGDVEHFRPKKAWQAAPGQPRVPPGYFWLVYDWDNLMLSCEVCNSRHKRNFFPLRDETRRATPEVRDISQEEPLLIDPYREEPSSHLSFDQWDVFARDASEKGTASIEFCGLDDQSLIEKRRDRLREVSTVLDLVEDSEPTAAARAEGIDFLQRSMSGEAEFAGMIRANLGARIEALTQ